MSIHGTENFVYQHVLVPRMKVKVNQLKSSLETLMEGLSDTYGEGLLNGFTPEFLEQGGRTCCRNSLTMIQFLLDISEP